MSDVAFIVLTIAVFGVMALVVGGVERLVGPVVGRDWTDRLGGEGCTVGLERAGVLPDGRVVR